MADLIYNGPADSADGAAGTAPGAPPAFGSADSSQVTGQDPASFLGIPFSYNTGLGGSPPPGGQGMGGGDPTNQPNQYPGHGTFTHVPLDGTGLDGSQGVEPMSTPTNPTTMQVTDPNNFAGHAGGGSGTQMITVTDSVSGPDDWTATQDNYPPTRPIIPGGFYPAASGAGDGSVKVGGFLKGQRG